MKRLRRAQFNVNVSGIKPESKNDFEPPGSYKQSNATDITKDENLMLKELNITSENLKVLDKIGEGTFGIVLKATLACSEGDSLKKVALKSVKQTGGCRSDSEATSNLLTELKVMCKIGHHPNVVDLLGVCRIEASLYIVMEYLPGGTLLEFLRRCRSTKGNPHVDISEHELLRLALGVCQAMDHLTSCELIHGDLSTRNILLNEQRVPKIIDFGMSRDFKDSRLLDAKSKGPQGKLPIKWMAIESLRHGIFTKKSDVWSFGVVLWEIITLGGSPYPGIPSRHLLNRLVLGYRMEKPPHSSTRYYEIMKRCWEMDPSVRITFSEIVISLRNLLQQCDRENFIELETLCKLYPFMDLGLDSRHTLQ